MRQIRVLWPNLPGTAITLTRTRVQVPGRPPIYLTQDISSIGFAAAAAWRHHLGKYPLHLARAAFIGAKLARGLTESFGLRRIYPTAVWF
jgi:hypothetical protein